MQQNTLWLSAFRLYQRHNQIYRNTSVLKYCFNITTKKSKNNPGEIDNEKRLRNIIIGHVGF